MSYTVKFTDNSKLSSAIVVEDRDGNSVSTSLKFVGKNASAYAEDISTNFLHILENFSNNLPPNNPIEGQVWYDSANKKLKINDGTAQEGGFGWKSVAGVYQEIEEPQEAMSGDMWVDTASFQLKVKNNLGEWILIGPSLDGSSRSGSIPETINDTFGNSRSVIKNYINGEVVEIISPAQFTPQIKIDGFDVIKAGLNLTTVNSAILNATSYAAQNILVTSPTRSYVSSNYLVRNDIDNSINGVLNAKKGITLGIDPTFSISKEGTFKNKFVNLAEGGSFAFQILNDEVYSEILTIDGTNNRVGVNNISPQADLDVVGSANISGVVTLASTEAIALNVTGGAKFGKAVIVSSTTLVAGTSSFQSGIVVGSSTGTSWSPEQAIKPALHNIYSIGSTGTAFKQVHAATFKGSLSGTADVAKELAFTATFTISGDVKSLGIQYSGKGDQKTFVAELTESAITSKNEVSSVSDTDEILVAVKPIAYTYIPANLGSGNGATFNLTRATSGAYENITVANSGTNYAPNDLLTVYGTYLGGTTPGNDLVMQVDTVNVIGSIVATTKVSGSGVTGLNKATKEGFLSDVLDYLIPAGTIMPYAGLDLPSPGTVLSPGWLFCDGSVVNRADYPKLFASIGFTYGKTLVNGQFRLPDLRGRMIIGYDDMSNGFFTSGGAANRVVGANSPNRISAANGTAPVVAGGVTTATLSAQSYSAQYPYPTPGFGSTSSGIITTVMNPFIAVNYIIKA